MDTLCGLWGKNYLIPASAHVIRYNWTVMSDWRCGICCCWSAKCTTIPSMSTMSTMSISEWVWIWECGSECRKSEMLIGSRNGRRRMSSRHAWTWHCAIDEMVHWVEFKPVIWQLIGWSGCPCTAAHWCSPGSHSPPYYDSVLASPSHGYSACAACGQLSMPMSA